MRQILLTSIIPPFIHSPQPPNTDRHTDIHTYTDRLTDTQTHTDTDTDRFLY